MTEKELILKQLRIEKWENEHTIADPIYLELMIDDSFKIGDLFHLTTDAKGHTIIATNNRVAI